MRDPTKSATPGNQPGAAETWENLLGGKSEQSSKNIIQRARHDVKRQT